MYRLHELETISKTDENIIETALEQRALFLHSGSSRMDMKVISDAASSSVTAARQRAHSAQDIYQPPSERSTF